MSIAILNDVYTELRRLAIAGSVVAPGDFRLKKLIEPLRKSGEKAPVFTRVAECIEQVVDSTEKTASTALLELGSLVGSILYTQGTTGADGDIEDLPPSPITMQKTQTSARVLKPLLEALTSTGSGRFEQIKAAHEMNLFNDLRLVRPALLAIDDSYSEIREFVADKILPTYGLAILSELMATLDVKGKAGHGRRLKVIHKIAPDEARPLVTKALEEGSKEVKLVAIECLGDSDDDLSYLLEQAKARSKDVRSAALLSLSRLNSPEAQELLVKTLDTNDVDLLHRAAQELVPKALIAGAVQRSERELAALNTVKDKAKQKSAVERLLWLLRIATSQLNASTEKLLMELLDRADSLSAIKSDPGGADLIALATDRLSEGSEAAAKYLVAKREQISADHWRAVIEAARKWLKPAEFFKTFSPYLDPNAKKKSPAEARSESLEYFFHPNMPDRFELGDHGQTNAHPLDPKWLELVIKLDIPKLVCSMAYLKDPGVHKYLSNKWESNKSKRGSVDDWMIACAMIASNHPEAQQTILHQVRACQTRHAGWFWPQMCSRLPASAIPELEAIIADPKTNDRLGNELLDAVQAIRERTQK